ncbi:hypothetical protein SLH46_21665, partial [Draconibacterium sp. IB214405]|uniref:hypothetical protein n=1 Tax=Draconibacterium sp. IB214405 TaxID=3097352 RepID=UPI002A0C0DF9
AIDVDGPEDMEVDHCDYLTQADLDDAFDAWIADFVVLSNECDADVPDLSGETAPDLCDGGTVSIVFAVTDSCSTDTARATFTVNAATAIDVDGPEDMEVDHCDYLTQADLDDAFDAWIADFVVLSNECDADVPDLSGETAPDLCDGGTVSIVFAVTDSCSTDTARATFTV